MRTIKLYVLLESALYFCNFYVDGPADCRADKNSQCFINNVKCKFVVIM